MREKVLFMVINMNVGGTEKALLNMIEKMPDDKYDITILMLEKYGGFLNYIPKRVKVECLKEYKEMKEMINNPPFTTVVGLIKKRMVGKGISFALSHLMSKLTKDRTILFRYILKNIPSLKAEYDIAIAYAGPMDFISYFIAERVKARRKFQWIHFDVTKIGFDPKFAAKVYKRFDKVFAVSQEGKDKLLKIVPSLKGTADVFINVISSELLLKQAEEGKGFEDQFDGVRILTVGRLSKEKGQDLVIPVLAKLRKTGLNVRWYCVGEGKARSEYEKLIAEYRVEKDFVLLGSTPNPYPFMKQCDIYVQPSRYEGYCITLAEAKCFNKPIISTDFTGAKEQMKDEKRGTVTSGEESSIYNAVEQKVISIDLSNKIFMNRKKF